MKETLKDKLRRNQVTLGSWVTLASSAVAELMAAADFDWLVIDAEHSVIELAAIQEMIQAMDRHGMPSIVRLTSNNPDQIKRVMDAGAHGIMVPSVRSPEDAKRAVDAVYYPPRGSRGVGLARAQGYGNSFRDYVEWLEKDAVVILMIEHIDAVRCVDEVLGTPGVDGYIIGPYDLSASLGKPGRFDDPEVQAAIATTCAAGKRRNMPGGIHVVDPDLALVKQRLGEGFTFIGYGMDVRMIDRMCREHLEDIRGTL